MEGEHRVGQGAYREGRVVVPRAPSRGRPLVAVGAALVVTLGGAVNAARAWRRAAAAVTATPVADVTRVFVRDATRIVGGGRICAVTGGARRPGVTCLVENASVSGGKVVTWPGGAVESLTTDGRVMGVLRDGRGVQLRLGAKEAEPAQWSADGFVSDRVVELRSSVELTRHWYYTSGDVSEEHTEFWWARTARGALLIAPADVRQGRDPTTVVTRGLQFPMAVVDRGVRDFAVAGSWYCAVTDEGRTTCAQGYLSQISTLRPPSFVLPQLRDPRQIALAGALLCVRGGDGAVRCLDQYRSVSYDLVGLPGGAVAMALGEQDLCVRAHKDVWWCARGPREDAPTTELVADILGFRPAPRLDGAEEVAFAPGVGCARWRTGLVRCWGPRAAAL